MEKWQSTFPLVSERLKNYSVPVYYATIKKKDNSPSTDMEASKV